jgi:hypothetical protein
MPITDFVDTSCPHNTTNRVRLGEMNRCRKAALGGRIPTTSKHYVGLRGDVGIPMRGLLQGRLTPAYDTRRAPRSGASLSLNSRVRFLSITHPLVIENPNSESSKPGAAQFLSATLALPVGEGTIFQQDASSKNQRQATEQSRAGRLMETGV